MRIPSDIVAMHQSGVTASVAVELLTKEGGTRKYERRTVSEWYRELYQFDSYVRAYEDSADQADSRISLHNQARRQAGVRHAIEPGDPDGTINSVYEVIRALEIVPRCGHSNATGRTFGHVDTHR